MDFDPRWCFTDLAAAFVRGSRPEFPRDLSDGELCRWGEQAGLRLYRFKRNAELPRVRRVLGALAGLGAADVLDLGSGRGTFLWPLLDRFPGIPVRAVERDAIRARDLRRVARGGIQRLEVTEANVESLPLEDDSRDVVCALEILEHLETPGKAAAEAVRVGRRFVVVTVPSRADDNPEHLRLFTPDSLRRLFLDAGAVETRIEGVPNHLFALVKLEGAA